MSKLYQQSCVHARAREIIRYGIAVVLGVGNPVVGVHIVDAEDVEGVEAEPYIAEGALPPLGDVALFVVHEAVAHANIHTTVGWSTEDMSLTTRVGRPEG